MFSRLLIANRGEIACRIIRTARRMGIEAVAVYSEADAHSRHVRLADQAVPIGPAAAQASYLSVERLLEAAARAGADAIHPGYGFLSENPEFAAACAGKGIVFIGPDADTIRAMGDKSRAKAIMERAGVPVVPGYHGDEQGADRLFDAARRIGFPVLIKAVAGGGGKGMQIVGHEQEFPAALASCQRTAAGAFGDARVLVEKYIVRPRHVEVQVFGDSHGNCVHLFERDCSTQRRHQKVLEEAPAPDLPDGLRAALAAAALDAARAVRYVGAGTVEFVLSREGEFHFLEMNTRLQVEHPVTEMITGLDLVEWQIRVAAGEALPLAQEQLSADGHAFEARLYAEDPARGFLPSTGTLTHFVMPAESSHVRIDSGVEQGDRIDVHYDPMIAKLVVWDRTRELARRRLLSALAQVRMVGLATNAAFLARIVASPAFAAADLDTGLIERDPSLWLAAESAVPETVWLVAALATLLRERRAAHAHAIDIAPWGVADGWRLNDAARRRLVFRSGECETTVCVEYAARGFRLGIAGRVVDADGELLDNDELSVDLGGMRLRAAVVVSGERRHVFLGGRSWDLVRVDPQFRDSDARTPDGGLRSPMPGKVIALLVAAGAAVEAGAPLMVLEAMKMEHTIRAPVAGTVRAFRHAVGEQIDDGVDLVDFVASESAA